MTAEPLFDIAPVELAPEPIPAPRSFGKPAFPPTERGLLDALHVRYSHVLGNGRRYVVAEHVRSHASFDARRTADFVALDTWKSGKFSLHGHEVKVSRSDWLRELKEPDKAAEFIPWMNYWWIVVPDPAIVRDGELPAMWGLMTLAGRHLQAVKAARRQERTPLPDTRLVALMRAVQRTAETQQERKKLSANTGDRTP